MSSHHKETHLYFSACTSSSNNTFNTIDYILPTCFVKNVYTPPSNVQTI